MPYPYPFFTKSGIRPQCGQVLAKSTMTAVVEKGEGSREGRSGEEAAGALAVCCVLLRH